MSGFSETSQPRFRIAGNYATRAIAGEMIVVPIRSNVADLESIYTLNEVGAAIWARLGTGRSVPEIAEALADEFDVSADTALEDASRFVAALLDEGLVERQAD